ncbi:MAG: hypothetical protein PHH00_00105 [Candidatus Nanoarchaeia archaeon]|nr:hypothetical protein [Candidatus Nanoarchaeia archaeon]
MDPVKEAFRKVKEDMDSLIKEVFSLKTEVFELKEELKKLSLSNAKPLESPTNQQINQAYPKEIPTHNTPYNALKPQNLGISTGNQGVPTNKPTDKQTNRQMPKGSMDNALNILNSLDNIKKEIRLKFKDLTDQEFLVFSTIYQLDEEQGFSDYRTISKRLNLSESSVRDYVGKLIKKEIPVEKIKMNNKNIKLSVSENLKKIVSLSTIFQLRDI